MRMRIFAVGECPAVLAGGIPVGHQTFESDVARQGASPDSKQPLVTGDFDGVIAAVVDTADVSAVSCERAFVGEVDGAMVGDLFTGYGFFGPERGLDEDTEGDEFRARSFGGLGRLEHEVPVGVVGLGVFQQYKSGHDRGSLGLYEIISGMSVR